MATTETKIVVTADTRQAQRALGDLQGTLSSLVSVAALGGLVGQFIKLADASNNLKNKLSLVTQEGQSSNDLFLVMAKSAMELGAPLKDVGDLFFRVANNTKDLGLAQTDQLKITETLIKGFQLTGATMGETQGAIVQLGQAFATGTLRGDELNSVLESLPMVADALSAKFGVQRGALKSLGEQGKITSKDLSDAILASGASIDKAWANKIPTVSQAFTKLQTALQLAVSKFDDATGASEAMSLAILKITIALVKVIKFFEDWADVIKIVVSALAALAAFTIIGRIMSVVGAALTGATRAAGMFTTNVGFVVERIKEFGTVFKAAGGGVLAFAETLIFTFLPIGRLAKAVLGLGAAVLTFLGISDLFPKDKQDSVQTYTDLNKELSKVLGTDVVQASDKATKATGGLNAEQVKNAGIISKAFKDRDADLQKMMRDQESELVLHKYIGDELTIQQALYTANKNLVREIKDANGNIIGMTKGLNAEEENQLRILTAQSIELKRQQDIRQKLASYSVPLKGSAAGADVAGQMSNLDPITAAQTANETLYSGLEYLRQQDLISEQAYQAAKVNAAVTAQTAIMDANKRQFENQELLRIQSQTGSQFSFESQKQMAKEAADFQMKSDLEKAQWGMEQGAQMFSALGAQNKKAFEAAKAFNIANAIMNTYMGVTKSLATYPFPFNMVAAAASLAMGMAQVSQIRSQQYSGRSLGGPVMGGNPYIVGENGPELFTPNTTGSITRNSDLGGGGPTNINFTIQANDAQGFDDLLTQRRGMITQFVRDAMQEQGQRSKM